MGNSSRSPEDYELVSKFREAEWSKEVTEEGVQIWRNRSSRESAVAVGLGGVPGSADLDIYTTRTMENDLIKVHHLLIDKHSDLCSLYNSAQLLVEHIPLRLCALRNFDREEALTIFCSALRAFHLLQIKFGPVVPHQELIGFNEQGKTKVWINRNSTANYADQSSISEQYRQQGRRVQLLFEIIEQRARYVLLPPVIKQEIYRPLTSHLTALKTLEKFAYYERLNLRKYLLLSNQKVNPVQRTPRRTHTRNHSYLTEAKPWHQVQDEQSVFSCGGRQIEMRRNYSLNNILNQASFCISPQVAARRSDMQSMFRRSIISNNTSAIESAPPSVVINANQRIHPQVSDNYHRQETAAFNTITLTNKQQGYLHEHIQTHPQTPAEKEQKIQQCKDIFQHEKQTSKKEHVQQLQLYHVIDNNKHQIINKINHFVDQITIKHFESIDEPINQAQIQPKSPTFVQHQQIKYHLPSFAPSQQNYNEIKEPQNNHGNELNIGLLEDKMNNILLNQQQEQTRKRLWEEDEERRLSIQQKASKLVFKPDFMLNPGSLLNYCTSVESKLHMATNRQHSIIDHKQKTEHSSRHLEQQYGQKQRIETKFIVSPQPPSITHHNRLHKQSKMSHLAVEQDFLDVNFLQKSLDKRYSNRQHTMKQAQRQRQIQENDVLNIAKLQEGLLKFSKSQLSQKNSDIPSKEHTPLAKKYQSIEFNVQRSTGFESYHPFRQKRMNQETSYQHPYLHQKQMNRRASRHPQQYPKPQKRQLEDNINQYSFEQNLKAPLMTKETQPSNKARGSDDYASPLLSKPLKGRGSVQEEGRRSSKEKAGGRKISYQQLVQFLWN